MPARVAKPEALPWLTLREAISSMSGPGRGAERQRGGGKKGEGGEIGH